MHIIKKKICAIKIICQYILETSFLAILPRILLDGNPIYNIYMLLLLAKKACLSNVKVMVDLGLIMNVQSAVIHNDIDFINLYILYFLITFRLRIMYFYDFTGFKSQKLTNELKYSYFTGVL